MVWAERAYPALADWAWVQWLWLIEIVTHPRGRFEVQPKRWIVEPSFGWLNRSGRLTRPYERTPESDEAFVCVAMIHLMVRRFAR